MSLCNVYVYMYLCADGFDSFPFFRASSRRKVNGKSWLQLKRWLHEIINFIKVGGGGEGVAATGCGGDAQAMNVIE